MSDIIRAEKLIYDAFTEKGNVLSPLELAELMKQFAKLHVEAALKAASEEAGVVFEGAGYNADAYVDKQSILKAYDLNDIK